jgi:hypothetical protein
MSAWFKRFMAEWWIEILATTLIAGVGVCLWLPRIYTHWNTPSLRHRPNSNMTDSHERRP